MMLKYLNSEIQRKVTKIRPLEFQDFSGNK